MPRNASPRACAGARVLPSEVCRRTTDLDLPTNHLSLGGSELERLARPPPLRTRVSQSFNEFLSCSPPSARSLALQIHSFAKICAFEGARVRACVHARVRDKACQLK